MTNSDQGKLTKPLNPNQERNTIYATPEFASTAMKEFDPALENTKANNQ